MEMQKKPNPNQNIGPANVCVAMRLDAKKAKGHKTMRAVARHYDLLAQENHDPVYDPKPLRDYMDKWDGAPFIEKMPLNKTKSVLEIGVGTGRLAVRVAPLCSRFMGVDLSPKTIAKAEKNLQAFGNAVLLCGDFLTIEFCEAFDVIYSSLTFMHIKEKQQAMDKVYTLLKDHGIFALSIDKNPADTIDIGKSRIRIFPDGPAETAARIAQAKMTILSEYETEFAHIFIAGKPAAASSFT